jgi:uncharacterized protein YwqG
MRQKLMTTPNEMQQVLGELAAHGLPAVQITPLAQAPASAISSKFGGQPWWPRALAYPQTAAGAPLSLLAQFNLAELPPLPLWPRQGLLQFFLAPDESYGLDFERPLEQVLASPDGYRVVFHPACDGEALSAAELPPLPAESLLPLAGEYALRFAATDDLPAPSDYRFEAIARQMDNIDDTVIDKLFDAGLGTGSKLGGYAYFTQEDPRPYAKTQLQSQQPWQLLFQMDTHDEDDGVWIMWGDCGVGNFFIEPERLAVGDFSRVWYSWDCC